MRIIHRTETRSKWNAHPAAVDAAVKARREGKTLAEQVQAAAEAIQEARAEDGETHEPLIDGDGGEEIAESAPQDAAEDVTEAAYRRFALARVLQDARGVDWHSLPAWQIDDVLALGGKRLEFHEWFSIRFPSE